MDDIKENPDMLTVTEAAQEAGVTQSTIRNAIYRGRLPATQHYGRQLIRRRDFEAYRQTAKVGRPVKSENQH